MASHYSDKHIPIDLNSAAAEWVRFCSRGRKSPLAALDVNGRPGMAFVPSELFVDNDDPKLIKHLVDKFSAEIVLPAPLRPPPEGLRARSGVNVGAFPLPTHLRFHKPPIPTANVANLLRDAYDGSASVTSEMAAGVLGIVVQFASGGSPIGLNTVASPMALPLFSAQEYFNEVGGWNPFLYPAYAGKARVAAAWQLVECYKHFASLKTPVTTVAVLDGGFWLDGDAPGIPPGQGISDFGSSVYQLNLLDEGVSAGGANPNKCADGYTCPWHGNGSASIATATVGNNRGSAGTGGTVAKPVLFKSELSINQIFRCLHYCLHWGLDVLNMSFRKKIDWELAFPSSAWDNVFQYAADNGVILVAAAGNDGEELPDFNARPATRTPGTITVGFLDLNDQADSQSNFGDSVDIWAPGTNIPVMPDENNPLGSLESGTSAAAPFVSGILAMMRAVKPSMDTFEAKQLLRDHGWKGTGKVSIGVDAYESVLAAIGGKLPDDTLEQNDSPATASPLLTFGKPGTLVPFGSLSTTKVTALSHRRDADWYHFAVNDFSNLKLENFSYAQAGPVRTTLVPDDPNNRAEVDLVAYFAPGLTRLTGQIAPGNYKVRIDGAINVYELAVNLKPAPIQPDMFEPNNSFENATLFHLQVPGAPIFEAAAVGQKPGSYPLTIHNPADQDFFRIVADPSGALPMVVTIRVSQSDAPLDITVFDNSRAVVQHLSGKHNADLTTRSGSRSFLKISSTKPTRYWLAVRYEVDKAHLPGALQNAVVTPVPDPGDPAFKIGDEVTHFLVDLSRDRTSQSRLVFGAVNVSGLKAELLNAAGEVVQQGTAIHDGMHQALTVETAHLPSGTYFLRIGSASAENLSAGFNVERLPSIVGMG